MERLTARYNGRAIMVQEHENEYTTEEQIEILTDRLAAYEDTGLEPQEIKQLPSAWMEKVKELEAIGAIDRLRELAAADKEGRLVVLPCKVGDTVYRVWKTRGREPVVTAHYMTDIGMVVRWMHYFGETVFLAREEAERAMEGGKNDAVT